MKIIDNFISVNKINLEHFEEDDVYGFSGVEAYSFPSENPSLGKVTYFITNFISVNKINLEHFEEDEVYGFSEVNAYSFPSEKLIRN